MDKDKNILNNNEKTEIVTDVKAAFDKARQSSNIDYHSKPNNNHSKSIVFPSVIIILIIAIAGIYYFLANNPKTIFIRSTDAILENLNNIIKTPTNNGGTIDIDYTLNPQNDYIELNKYKYKINYTLDTLTNTSKSKIKITYENKPLDDITLYTEESNMYLLSEDILTKYIKLDNINKPNYDAKNIKTMISSLNTAFINSLDGQKFTSSHVDLTINDKTTKTYQVSLILNNENINNLLDNINTALKDDTRFINSYSKVFNIEKQNVTNEIDNKINNLKNKLQTTNNLSLNIYTDGLEHAFKKLELVQNINDKYNTYSITNIGKNKYSYLINSQIENKKQTGNITIKEKEDKMVYNITLNKTSGTVTTLNSSFKISIIEKEKEAIEKEETEDAITHTTLPPETKNMIDTKFEPIQKLINLIKN